jgi:hypothetical protein
VTPFLSESLVLSQALHGTITIPLSTCVCLVTTSQSDTGVKGRES